ncbi:MAG: chloride channel protein [Bacteroidales bacterium]|nr:MAG: chloride channel protein [Bacteroidales bacterium]
MKNPSALERFINWRKNNISDREFILILSVIVGLASGLSAVVIKNLVHIIQVYLADIAARNSDYLYIFYPLIGILITVLFIKYINRKPVTHGVPNVLFSISKRNGIIRRHNLYSSVISSAITVGFGGSVGLEGPTVATGAAIGSNIGRLLHLNYKQIILLLSCACAGAMSAIFKAPIAAIVFAIEVIMFDLTMAAIVPLLISSATAALTSYLFLGQNVLYAFEIQEKFHLNDLGYYILLGVFTGFLSVYFTKINMLITGLFDKLKNTFSKLFIGGIVLGLLIFLIPSLYGEGYSVINNSLHGDFTHLFHNTFYENLNQSFLLIIIFFTLVMLLKVVATSITFESGGVGGFFAPALFTGVNAGLFFAKFLNNLGLSISESNFALVGMAGLIAGVIHAPLTAIFLIAEITGGYELFMPLMIVAAISYATVKLFTPNSVYTIQLARRGELMTHHKDKTVLMMLDVKKLIETDFNKLHPNNTLGDLIKIITHAHRNIFPVVEKDDTFRGIVKMDDIRHIMFNHEMYEHVYVRDLMFMPQYVIDPKDTMEEIARKFQISERYNIAVIEKGKYLGFVSRAKLFSTYRKMLSDFSEH